MTEPSKPRPSEGPPADPNGGHALDAAATHPARAPRRSGVLAVPIRAIGATHRDKVLAHLQQLDTSDRYLRFGYQASDAQISRHVDTLDFERDELFGIYNRHLALIAVAHLAYAAAADLRACAEFGVSVLAHARGRGYGTRLFERAVMHARNEGVELLFIHALSENRPMLHIAKQAGATVVSHGSDSEAHVLLPPATLDTRVSELVQERYAETNYQLKFHAQRFLDALADLQEVRQGVRDARHRSSG